MARKAATVKKTYNLPPDLVSRAKRILRASTETETIVLSRCAPERPYPGRSNVTT